MASLADRIDDHELDTTTPQEARARFFGLVTSAEASPAARQMVVVWTVQAEPVKPLYEADRQPLLDVLAAAKALAPDSQYVPLLSIVEAMVRDHEFR